MRLFRPLAPFAMMLLPLLAPATAQDADIPSERALREGLAEGARPAKPNKVDRGKRLDNLFEALKRAPDAQISKAVESRLEAALLQSGSATADLLMTRVRAAMEAKDVDLAIRLLDAIVEIEPTFAEAWARRATIHYMRKDLGRSLADLRVVLAREPRHYGALTGLGVIMQDLGEDKRALDAFRRALEINPHLPGVPDFIKKLTDKVQGRDI